MEILILVLISFVSSALTAVLGIGGGILLISLMPGLIPAAAIIPVHGVVQLASNSTRAFFGRQEIVWSLVGAFTAGALLGAALGSQVVVALPVEFLPLLLGSFILFVTWTPKLGQIRWPGRFFTVGGIQTFVSLFVGAAGPLISPLLLREGLSRDRIVVTHGAMMTVMHGFKLVTFALLGFSFRAYLPLLAGMTIAVTLGSWFGTQLRSKVPEKDFRRVFRWLLTFLALRLILRFFL